MLKRKLNFIFLFSCLLIISPFIIAQDMENTQDKSTQNCMEKIAADSTLRTQMMNMMMERNQNDKEAMMSMCKTMMENPEMHKTMKSMMSKDGKMNEKMNHEMKMKSDSTKMDGMMRHEMKGDSTKMKNGMKQDTDDTTKVKDPHHMKK